MRREEDIYISGRCVRRGCWESALCALIQKNVRKPWQNHLHPCPSLTHALHVLICHLLKPALLFSRRQTNCPYISRAFSLLLPTSPLLHLYKYLSLPLFPRLNRRRLAPNKRLTHTQINFQRTKPRNDNRLDSASPRFPLSSNRRGACYPLSLPEMRIAAYCRSHHCWDRSL